MYNQKIDSTNQMPSSANQLPSTGQSIPLSTERVMSTIPKGGTDNATWLYPSAQMVRTSISISHYFDYQFWNALVRKNKLEGVV